MKAAALALFSLLCPAPLLAAEAALGPLTLTYDPAEWQVDGTVIQCRTEGCGMAIDVAVVDDGGESCSREAMYTAAAAAFPEAPHHAVNPFVVGNLLLWLGLSSHELGLEAGRAVRACVDAHEGSSVHFTSRLGAVWPGPDHAAAVFALLRDGLRSVPGEPEETVLGEIVIRTHTDAWRTDRVAEDSVLLRCLPPLCAPAMPVVVSVQAGDSDACAAEGEGGPGRTERAEIAAGDGLSFDLVTHHSPCRNMMPPQQAACAVHAGQTYVVAPLVPVIGCRTQPSVPETALLALIGGIGLAATP